MTEPFSLRLGLTRRLAVALLTVALVGTFIAYQISSRFGNDAYDLALVDDAMTLLDQITVENGALRVNLPAAALKWLLANQGETVLYRVVNLRSGIVVRTR